MAGKDSVTRLVELCENLPSAEMLACHRILTDPAFEKAPGGKDHHHNYAGGLAEHTLEVAELSMKFARGFFEDRFALVASVFHDYGKIHDYAFDGDNKIISTSFQKETGHLVWSWEFFREVAAQESMSDNSVVKISHAILAHHGRREWGSPTEPMTPLAWALHSADMLSSRGFKL
jgi:3'-5' exoribonuclease